MDPATAAAVAQPFSAAATSISSVNNHWQVLSYLVIGVFALAIMWVYKVAANSKKLVEAEKDATELRKVERDTQVKATNDRIDAEIKRIDQVFADHLEDHKKLEATMHESISKIEGRLLRIESDVHSICLSIERILTTLEIEDRRRMRPKHERDE